MRNFLPILIIATGIFASPLFGFAQSEEPVYALVLSPEFPEPSESFTVMLKGGNAQRSSIEWFIDGIENTASKNENTVTLQSHELGVATTIAARVTEVSGTTFEARETVVPVRLDLIVEADTIVPTFYKGRSLPSSGSSVSATAIFQKKGGLAQGAYSYLWKLNNKVQNGGALKGDTTFSFVPGFEKETLLSVEVFDSAGKVIARESQLIPILEPELYFYEKNPLRGLSSIALPDPYFFIGDEVTIRGEGYFMSKDLAGEDALRVWQIEGRDVPSDITDPQEITLQKNGASATSQLSFHLRNLRELLQGVQKTITISF